MKIYKSNRWGGWNLVNPDGSETSFRPGGEAEVLMQAEVAKGLAVVLACAPEAPAPDPVKARLEALASDLKALGLTVPSDAAAAEALK